MQIKNPTKNPIEIDYLGVHYRIEAEGTLTNIDDDVAHYWQSSLHNFLQIKKDSVKEETPIEVPKAPIEEKKEEVKVEPVKEDKKEEK